MIDYAAYRERVSKAWGPATAHPGYKAAGGSFWNHCWLDVGRGCGGPDR